jgi:hypothetical protein
MTNYEIEFSLKKFINYNDLLKFLLPFYDFISNTEITTFFKIKNWKWEEKIILNYGADIISLINKNDILVINFIFNQKFTGGVYLYKQNSHFIYDFWFSSKIQLNMGLEEKDIFIKLESTLKKIQINLLNYICVGSEMLIDGTDNLVEKIQKSLGYNFWIINQDNKLCIIK